MSKQQPWEEEKDHARKLDIALAWKLIKNTAPQHHHEKCSYRQADGGFLCDCAAIGVAYQFEELLHQARVEMGEKVRALKNPKNVPWGNLLVHSSEAVLGFNAAVDAVIKELNND